MPPATGGPGRSRWSYCSRARSRQGGAGLLTGPSAWLSVSDADLNLEDHVSVPRGLQVTLRGRWRLEGAPEEMTLADLGEAGTTVVVTCHDGAGFTARLVPAG